jgi:hypothetical protein
MLMLVGMGNPLGTRNPHGYEFGQNFIPVMSMSFLAGVFFLWVWVWASNIQRVFTHCHLYLRSRPCRQSGSMRIGMSKLDLKSDYSLNMMNY